MLPKKDRKTKAFPLTLPCSHLGSVGTRLKKSEVEAKEVVF